MEKPAFFSILTARVRYSEHLTDFEKILFSEISALTEKNGYCYAKNAYFADVFNKTIRTIQRGLENLKKHNFIEIEILENENKETIERRIYIKTEPKDVSKMTPSHDKNDTPPHDKNDTLNNINIYNNTSKEHIYTHTSKNDGLKLLLDEQINEQTARDYLTIRKAKKAPLTKTALNAIKKQASNCGLTLNEAIAFCVVNNWIGFKADWYLNKQNNYSTPKTNTSKESFFSLEVEQPKVGGFVDRHGNPIEVDLPKSDPNEDIDF